MKPSDNEIEMLAAGFAIQHKNGLIRFAHALLEKYASARASTVAGEAVNADFLASWEAQRHAGNEWADMATNGIQWMRNVKDGISTPEKALECLASNLAHCRATQARAGITPPAAPQASAEYERGHADGWAAGWDQAIKQPQADKDGGQQREGDEKEPR